MPCKATLLEQLGIHSNNSLRLDPATKRHAIEVASERLKARDFSAVDIIGRAILCRESDEAMAKGLLFEAAKQKGDSAVWYDLGEFFLSIGKRNDASYCYGQSLILGISPLAQQRQLDFLQESAARTRACPHLSQASAQTRCSPARKFRAVFS